MGTTADLVLAIVSIIVPFFGGLGTIVYFYFRDSIEREPLEAIAKTFLWGMLAGVIIVAITVPLFYGANILVNSFTNEWATIFFMIAVLILEAFLEETIKFVILWRQCFRLVCEVDGLYDGFFYGAVIGTGAAVIDASAYALLATNWIGIFQIELIRTIRIPGTQAIITGLVGLYCARHKFNQKKNVYPGIIFAFLLHTMWGIVTYIFHSYITSELWFYLSNFALIGFYLTFMLILNILVLRYDKKNFPEGDPNKDQCEIPQRRIRKRKEKSPQ